MEVASPTVAGHVEMLKSFFSHCVKWTKLHRAVVLLSFFRRFAQSRLLWATVFNDVLVHVQAEVTKLHRHPLAMDPLP